jgi:hypothetical protein
MEEVINRQRIKAIEPIEGTVGKKITPPIRAF